MKKPSQFVLLYSPLMEELGLNIVKHLKGHGVTMPHYKISFTTFANGEVLPQIPHTVRGQHVFLLHGLQHPDPNTAVMMMLIVNDAIKRASASGITLVTPYLPYLRQDRKDKPRVPITARLLADLIETNQAVKGLITIDMHAEQEQGFFSIPVDNLSGVKIFSEHIRKKFKGNLKDVVMLAPDFGGSVRNRRLAKALGDIPVCILEKRRPRPNESEILSVIGESIVGKKVVMYEDLLDTGGTAGGSAEKIIGMGAKEVYICATHLILSNDAEKKLQEKGICLAGTDSIPRSKQYYAENKEWLAKVTVASYFADAIYESTLLGGSISQLEQ